MTASRIVVTVLTGGEIIAQETRGVDLVKSGSVSAADWERMTVSDGQDGHSAIWAGNGTGTRTGVLYTTNVISTDEASALLDVLAISAETAESRMIAVCFVRGTKIETEQGQTLIEDLRAGDVIRTLDNGMQPIRWVGSHTVVAKGNLQPILISKGALDDDSPASDLVVSPKHRMVVRGWRAEVLFGHEEVLVAAQDLVNDSTIRRYDALDQVEYFHILMDEHQIIFSNGAASESFNPSDVALSNVEESVREEILTIFPELRENARAYGLSARMAVTGKEARLIAE